MASLWDLLKRQTNQPARGPIAEEKRQEYLGKSQDVSERMLGKAASIVSGLPVGMATLNDDEIDQIRKELAPEAAKKARWQAQELPSMLDKARVPSQVKEATDLALTGENKPNWFVRGLDWVLTQTGRISGAYTAQARTAREVEKGLTQKYLDQGIAPAIAKAKAASDASLYGNKRVRQAAIKGFKDPKSVPDLYTPEETGLSTDKTINLFGLKRSPADLASWALQLGIDIGLDPTTYIGIGPVSKLAKVAVKPTERLVQSVNKALSKAEQVTAARGGKVSELASISNKATKEAASAQKQLPKELQKLNATVTKLAEEQGKLRQAQTIANQMRREARLAPTRRLSKIATRTGEELAVKPPLTAKQVEQLSNRIQNLDVQRTAQVGKVTGLQSKLDKAVEAANAHKKAIASQRTAEQLANKLRNQQKQLKDMLKPEYKLKAFGKPIANVEPLIKGLREGWRNVALKSPQPVKEVLDALTGRFRATSPRYSTVANIEEHQQLSDVLPQLHEQLQQGSAKASLVGEETLRQRAGVKMPDEVRNLIPYFIEAKDQAEFLGRLAPEVRPLVEESAKVYSESVGQVAARLKKTFGDGYLQLLDNYVTHLYKDAPEQIRRAIDQFRKSKSKTIPGGNFPFAKGRKIPTLEEAKKLGLTPVENPALLEAVYKASSEKLINLKQTTDWLSQQGFLKAVNSAPKDWIDAGKYAPWLKGQAIHPEPARIFDALQPALEFNAKEIGQLDRAYRAGMNLFKGLVTSVRPAFHMVNVMGNVILMRMGGVPYAKIPGLLSKAVAETRKRGEVYKLFRQYALEGQGMFTDTAGVGRILPKLETQWRDLNSGTLSKVGRGVVSPITTGRRIGEAEDSIFRLATFQHFIDEGIAPEEAAKLVRRYLFDYSQLTSSERFARQYLVPFYSWARFAIPRSILAVVEQPGAYTGFYRLQEAVAKSAGVDRSQLPTWMQGAMVLGKDEEGKTIYVNPQPPWQTLLSYISGEPNAAGNEIARSLTPYLKGLMLATTGRDPETGKPVVEGQLGPNPGIARLKAVVKEFTPWGEVEKLYPSKLTPDKASTVGRVVRGLPGYPVSFLSTYDEPLAKEYEKLRAENVMDEYRRQREEEGVIMPTTAQVQSSSKELGKAEGAVNLLDDILAEPRKLGIILSIAASSKAFMDLNDAGKVDWLMQNLVVDNNDLFTGSLKEMANRLLNIYTQENYTKLATRLDRQPTPYDFLAYRNFLESGKKAVPSGVTKLMDTVKMYEQIGEARKAMAR